MSPYFVKSLLNSQKGKARQKRNLNEYLFWHLLCPRQNLPFVRYKPKFNPHCFIKFKGANQYKPQDLSFRILDSK